jgi:hypothetical protein
MKTNNSQKRYLLLNYSFQILGMAVQIIIGVVGMVINIIIIAKVIIKSNIQTLWIYISH